MGWWSVITAPILARKRVMGTSSMRRGLLEPQALAGFDARGSHVILEARLRHQIAKDNVGNLAAGRKVAGIMHPADHAIVRIIIGALENLSTLLRNNPYQDERIKVANNSMSARVGVGLDDRLANRVQRAIELVRTRALELALQLVGSRRPFALHPI